MKKINIAMTTKPTQSMLAISVDPDVQFKWKTVSCLLRAFKKSWVFDLAALDKTDNYFYNHLIAITPHRGRSKTVWFSLTDYIADPHKYELYISGGIIPRLYDLVRDIKIKKFTPETLAGDVLDLSAVLSDADIFFYDENIAQAFTALFSTNSKKYIKEKVSNYFEINPMAAIDLNYPKLPMDKNGHYQLIIDPKFCGEPKQVTEQFDFAHCRAWYDFNEEKLKIHPYTMWAIENKYLIPMYSDIKSNRYDKFVNQGWKYIPTILDYEGYINAT